MRTRCIHIQVTKNDETPMNKNKQNVFRRMFEEIHDSVFIRRDKNKSANRPPYAQK